jgi:hypothetical protein
MRFIPFGVAVTVALSSACLAQQWEIGAEGGYGWSYNPSIVNSAQSAEAGFAQKVAVGAVFAQNLYDYVGGEVRYLYSFGGPQVKSQGTQAYISGYTNAVTYDVLVHFTPRESNIRPFVSAGVGAKIYTGSGTLYQHQPLADVAFLTQSTQAEPALTVGGGVKWLLPKHFQLRVDLRTYMTPFPNQVISPTGGSTVHRWVFDFVPVAGIGYVF